MSRTGISFKDRQNSKIVPIDPYYYGCFDSNITRIYGRNIPYSSLYVYQDIDVQFYSNKQSLYIWEHKDRSGYWCYEAILTEKAQQALIASPSHRAEKVFQLIHEIRKKWYYKVTKADVEQLANKLEAILEQVKIACLETEKASPKE